VANVAVHVWRVLCVASHFVERIGFSGRWCRVSEERATGVNLVAEIVSRNSPGELSSGDLSASRFCRDIKVTGWRFSVRR